MTASAFTLTVVTALVASLSAVTIPLSKSAAVIAALAGAVSYTHLTLPTIYSV